jgi:hypothetical protein
MCQRILVKFANIKFNENPLISFQVAACGWADRELGMVKVIGAFL